MIVALLLASCTKEMRFQEPPLADGDKVPVALTCEPLDFELEEGTKSHLGNNILTKVSNVNYYLFDKEGNFVSQGYTEDLGEFGIALPDIDAHYQCFFFANVGRFAISETTKASDMGTAVHYDFQSYDNYSSSVNGYGFPMAAGVADFNKSNAGNVTVKRLVHTLRVKINTAALNASQLTVKNVRVRQAPRDFFPFAEKSKLTAQFDDQDILETGADWLSAEEVEKINNGEEVRLYILENMRGELIPGNTEWKNKTPQNIPVQKEATLATYIEIETSVVTPTANYENVVYRAYLGKSPSNFDVQRSTSFLLTNVFTSDMIPDEDWRIDPGTPVVTGILKFVEPTNDRQWSNSLKNDGFGETVYVNNPKYMIPPTVDKGYICPMCHERENFDISGFDFVCNTCGYTGHRNEFLSGINSVNSFYLTDGFKQVFYIYRSSKNISYSLKILDESSVFPHISYSTERYDDFFDKLTIWVREDDFASYSDEVDEYGFHYLSNGDITGCLNNVPRKIYPVKFCLQSSDGLLSEILTCNYFYGAMGSYLKTVGNDGRMSLRFSNPLQLYVSSQFAGAMETVMPGVKTSFVGGYKIPEESWYSQVPGKGLCSTDVTMPYFNPGGWSASAKLFAGLTVLGAIGTAVGVAISFTNPITGGLGVSVAHALGASLVFGVVGAYGTGAIIGTTILGIETYDEFFESLSNHDYRPFQIVRVPCTGAFISGFSNVYSDLYLDNGLASAGFSSNYFDTKPYNVHKYSLSDTYEVGQRFSLINKRTVFDNKITTIPFSADLHYTIIPGHWKFSNHVLLNGYRTFETYIWDEHENNYVVDETFTTSDFCYGIDVLSKQRGLIANTDRWGYKSTEDTRSNDRGNEAVLRATWTQYQDLFFDITAKMVNIGQTNIYVVDKDGDRLDFVSKDFRKESSWYPSSAIGYLRKYDDGIEGGEILDTKRFRHLMGIGGTSGIANENGVLGLCRKIYATSQNSGEIYEFAEAAQTGSSELLTFVASDNQEVESPEDPIIIYKNGTSYGTISMKDFLKKKSSDLPGNLSSHPITVNCNEFFFPDSGVL